MQKHVELKVWSFIVISVVLIASFFLYVAYKKDAFSKVYTYTFSSKSGEGFSEGTPLKFSGFTIGAVRRLELNDDGVVIIKIRIPERHIKWLRRDSIFILDRPLIGSPKITVFTDNLRSPVLSTEAVPEIYPIDSINDAIQKIEPLLDKIDRVLENSVRITATLSAGESLLEMALGDRETVRAINETLKQSKDLGRRLDAILATVESSAVKADDGLFGPGGMVPLVRDILRDVIDKLTRLDAVVDNLSATSSEVSKSTADLDRLRQDIDTAITVTNELLRTIDGLVPLRNDKEIRLP